MERAFTGVLGLELVFLPWAFGTSHLWSQTVAAGLALLAFALSLWPRQYSGEFAAGNEFRLVAWPRLLRFIPFWTGLLLFAVLMVQLCNPAWVYQTDGKVWWLHSVRHIDWLPSCVEAPFVIFNAWRALIIYGTVWLTVCAVWIGVTRRRTLQILFSALLINGVAVAVVGFIHRMNGEKKLLWLQSFSGTSFASFIYKNHAGAYLGLVSSIGLGLAFWHFFEARRRMARSAPTALWALMSLILFFAVFFSFSRGAALTLLIFAISALGAFVILQRTNATRSTTPRVVSIALALLFIAGIAGVFYYVDFKQLERQFRELTVAGESTVESRVLIREASWDMLRDNWGLGIGAGGYRYLSPVYVEKYPAIHGQVWWDHAHIDWLEVPIELGVPGTLLIFITIGWAGTRFSRGVGWTNAMAVMVFLGCAQTLLHALIDFPFQNAAILVTWWAMLVMALRWLEFEIGPPQLGS
jgi:hypothetical protein